MIAEFSRCNEEFLICNFVKKPYFRMFGNDLVKFIRDHWLMLTILRVNISMEIIHNSWYKIICNKQNIQDAGLSYMKRFSWSPCANWTQQFWLLKWHSPDAWWSLWRRFLQPACPTPPLSHQGTRRISPSL